MMMMYNLANSVIPRPPPPCIAPATHQISTQLDDATLSYWFDKFLESVFQGAIFNVCFCSTPDSYLLFINPFLHSLPHLFGRISRIFMIISGLNCSSVFLLFCSFHLFCLIGVIDWADFTSFWIARKIPAVSFLPSFLLLRVEWSDL